MPRNERLYATRTAAWRSSCARPRRRICDPSGARAAGGPAEVCVLFLVFPLLGLAFLGVRGRHGLAGRRLVLLDQLLDLGVAEIGLEEGEVVIHPAEAPQGLGASAVESPSFSYTLPVGLDRAALAHSSMAP
jgi:hypothetical protein